MFEVRLRSKRAERELDGLHEPDYDRVLAKLKILADNPRLQGCEKLYDNIYRIRVGDIRVIYFIDEENKLVDIGAIRRQN